MSSHHSHHSHHVKSKTVTTTTTAARTAAGIHVDEIHAQIPANFPPAELDFNELAAPPGFHYAPILENPLKHHHTEASVVVEKPIQKIIEAPLVTRDFVQEVSIERPTQPNESVREFVKVESDVHIKHVRTENELRIGQYLGEARPDAVVTMAEIQDSPTNIHSELLQQIRSSGPIARILQEHAAEIPLLTQQFDQNTIRVAEDDIVKREPEHVEIERIQSARSTGLPEAYQWTDRSSEEMLPEDTRIKSRGSFVQDFSAQRQEPIVGEVNQDYTKLAYGIEDDGSEKKVGMEFAIAGTGFLPPVGKKQDDDDKKEDDEQGTESSEEKTALSRAVDSVTAAAGSVAGFISSHMPGATPTDSETTETVEKTVEVNVSVPEEHHAGIVESVTAAAGTVVDFISSHMPSATTTDTESGQITEETVEVEVTASVPEEHHAGLMESMAAAAGSVAGFISAHMPHAAEPTEMTAQFEEGITDVTEDAPKGLVDSAMDKITSFFSGSTTQETEQKEEAENQNINDDNNSVATEVTEVTEIETTFTEALEEEQEPRLLGTDEIEIEGHHDQGIDQEVANPADIEVAEREATLTEEAKQEQKPEAGQKEQEPQVVESETVEVKKKTKNHKNKHRK